MINYNKILELEWHRGRFIRVPQNYIETHQETYRGFHSKNEVSVSK